MEETHEDDDDEAEGCKLQRTEGIAKGGFEVSEERIVNWQRGRIKGTCGGPPTSY